MAALARMGMWANSMGVIILATLLVAFNLSKDALNFSPIQQLTGMRETCQLEYSYDIKTPSGTKQVKRSKLIGEQACNLYSEEQMQIMKKWEIQEIASPPPALITDPTKPGVAISNVKIERVFTGNTPIYEKKPPPITTSLIKLASAFLVLVAGFFVYRFAGKVWIRIFGRVSDPVWAIKK